MTHFEELEQQSEELRRAQDESRSLRMQLAEYQKTTMSEPASCLLIQLTAVMVATMIAANLLALKILDFCSIPVDGGIWLFPLTYIAGDALCEIYGKTWADRVAYLCTGAGVVMVLLFHIVNGFPGHFAADNSVYEGLVATGSKVMLASFLSFLAGQLINNIIFERIWRKNKASHSYGKRSLGSSIVAHLVDALVFETIAFYGRLPLEDFIRQVGFALIAGLLIEVAVLPLNIYLTEWLVMRVQYRHGQSLTSK